jgi:hypothetical protein
LECFVQSWYLYVVGGSAVALVAFAHLDERARERRYRALPEKVEAPERQRVSGSDGPDDPASGRP